MPQTDSERTPEPPRHWQRTVTLFLSGQALSLFGSAVVMYAVIWYIALETQSAWTYTLVLLAAIVPQGVMSLWGGVWADRYDRKKLVIVADSIIAVVTVGVAIAFIAGGTSLLLISAALLVRGVASGVQMPTVSAIIPQLTPPQHLLRVNAINGSIQSAVFLASPALAAVLLTIWPLGWIFLVDVATAIVGIGILLVIHIPHVQAEVPDGGHHALREMREGVRYAMGQPALRRVLLIAVVLYILIMPMAQLAPVVVVKLFGDAAWMLAAVEIAYSGAMIVGGALLAAWGGPRNRMTMMLVVAALWCVLTVAQGFTPWIWLYIALWAAFGLVAPGITSTSMTVMAELTPPTMLGRVMGLSTLVFSMVAPLGMLAVGPLADVVSVRYVLVVCGVLSFIGIAILSVRAPAIMRPEAPASDNVLCAPEPLT
jgi:DHA3 family macrolide efflux protein-like MFS transporter